MSIATISLEWVTLGPVTVTDEDDVTTTITSYQVAVAPYGQTPSLDVFTDSVLVEGKVRILIGPGGLELPRGDYRVWVRYEDSPEAPAFPIGRFTVT